jgi:glucose-fructose oxidoreductase
MVPVARERLIDEGTIGDVLEVHYYDGNRGPLFLLPRSMVSDEEVQRQKPDSWW